MLIFNSGKMKVHLIKRLSIDSYSAAHADGKAAFDRWVYLVRQANWKVPADIIKTFNHADILGRGVNRVVFNIGGNSYRLICKYFFGKTMVHLFVVWVGTHAEYDKLCGEQKQYDVNMF